MNAARVLQIIGFALTLAAGVALCFLPAFQSVTSDSDGHQATRTQTLLQMQGSAYLLVLVIPVLIAAVPLLLRGRAWRVSSIVAAVLLGVFALVGALSIGVFYLPAAIVEVVAACLPVRRPEVP
ncbi:hypothetical protein [Microbacterium elymi]|uniref:DUF4064 domain-containing protein n=1 Tax=Microbacterium elymi TaxID=2909587 RepID=A0ABY5NLA4_9MICO|nr:hypothetical protein [Microbacterium elymi]UUT35940.1 hypothetical protein L2X98_22645 [Microbacterium elymi]